MASIVEIQSTVVDLLLKMTTMGQKEWIDLKCTFNRGNDCVPVVVGSPDDDNENPMVKLHKEYFKMKTKLEQLF